MHESFWKLYIDFLLSHPTEIFLEFSSDDPFVLSKYKNYDYFSIFICLISLFAVYNIYILFLTLIGMLLAFLL